MAPVVVRGSSKISSNKSSRSWEALTPGLSEWILSAVSSMGLSRTTPVQASCIPLFMAHKDVVVEAVTGSGKTLAFLIPVVERLLRLEERTKRHHVAAIIISPTTELARQIHTVLNSLLAFHAPSAAAMRPLDPEDESSDIESEKESAVSYPSHTPIVRPQLLVAGPFTPAQDLNSFLHQSPNLLVATPGRLLELLSSSHVHCTQLSFEVLVLDEADRLLEMGFKDDMQKILGRLPKQRRTGLFSATVGEAVDQIVRVGLRNPVKIAVKVRASDGGEDKRTPASLQMSYIIKPASQKLPAINKILSSLTSRPHKIIIYVSTCAAVEYFQHVLPIILPKRDEQVFTLVSLHGKQQQKARQMNFARFANATSPSILLTTDVAARGLDIPQVDLVLQIDPPNDPKVFVHRCGRAGRAGRKGLSIVFLQPGREEDYVAFMEIRKTPLTKFLLPETDVFDADAQQTTTTIRKLVITDRALHDKAQRGFVSWAQAYSKHQASSLFRIADQDWTDLGNAWGLLKLPKMPELRQWEGEKSLGITVDWQSYGYKDKAREQVRQKAISERVQTHPSDTTVRLEKERKGAWSNKLDQRNEREVRRLKKHKRREWDRWEHMMPAEREKQRELDNMIQAVKRKRMEDDLYEEFEGFDD